MGGRELGVVSQEPDDFSESPLPAWSPGVREIYHNLTLPSAVGQAVLAANQPAETLRNVS